jgi:DNA-binding beta-propeller fold protein YncE
VILHTPHGITVDEQDRVYVADRERHWVQVLSAEGEVLSTWKKVGAPLSIRYHKGSIYVLSNLSGTRGIVRRLNLSGELQDSFHTRGLGKIQDYEWPHGLAVSDGGDTVYVGFVLTARRVQRYTRINRAGKRTG